MKKHYGSIAVTLLLFVILAFFSAALFSSISKDVELQDFSVTTPEGNVFVQDFTDAKLISYRWYYQGLHTVSLHVTDSQYTSFLNKDRSFSRDYSYYVQDNSSLIDDLAKELLRIAAIKEYSQSETASFIASFVQSLRGTPDYYDDYPQFSLETIYLNTGDCEDVAILGSRLLRAAGFDIVLIELADHVGVGVNIPGSGDSFTYENKTYYYLELTGVNYILGELPEQYRGYPTVIYNPDLPVLNPVWDIKKITRDDALFYNLTLQMQNDFTGNITAEIIYNDTSKESVSIEIEKERVASLILPLLPSLDHRLLVEFRGVSANPVFLQTGWVTQY